MASRKRAPQSLCPDKLTTEQRDSFLVWVERFYPNHATRYAAKEDYAVAERMVFSVEWERHRDHFQAIGEFRADWLASFRNWFRNRMEWDHRDNIDARGRYMRRTNERPQERGTRGESAQTTLRLYAGGKS